MFASSLELWLSGVHDYLGQLMIIWVLIFVACCILCDGRCGNQVLFWDVNKIEILGVFNFIISFFWHSEQICREEILFPQQVLFILSTKIPIPKSSKMTNLFYFFVLTGMVETLRSHKYIILVNEKLFFILIYFAQPTE